MIITVTVTVTVTVVHFDEVLARSPPDGVDWRSSSADDGSVRVHTVTHILRGEESVSPGVSLGISSVTLFRNYSVTSYCIIIGKGALSGYKYSAVSADSFVIKFSGL